MYQKLDEILAKVQEKPYQPFHVHNPEGRDLLFKGKEIISVSETEIPELGADTIRIIVTDKYSFVILDGRCEKPIVLRDKYSLTFGCLGYDRVAKAIYGLLGIESFEYV